MTALEVSLRVFPHPSVRTSIHTCEDELLSFLSIREDEKKDEGHVADPSIRLSHKLVPSLYQLFVSLNIFGIIFD